MGYMNYLKGDFKNGNGTITYYLNNDACETFEYKKGKKIGEFKYYDKNGTLIRTKKYRRFLFW